MIDIWAYSNELQANAFFFFTQRALYEQILIDWRKRGRGNKRLADPSNAAEGIGAERKTKASSTSSASSPRVLRANGSWEINRVFCGSSALLGERENVKGGGERERKHTQTYRFTWGPLEKEKNNRWCKKKRKKKHFLLSIIFFPSLLETAKQIILHARFP